MNLKSIVSKQLQADTTELIYQQPFLAMLLMRLKLVVVIDDRLQTAATDGTHIFVDARFMHSLSQADRVFVLAHEVWHCAMGHFVRRRFLTEQSREHKLWNYACDYEVNAIVKAQLHHLPDFVLYAKPLVGMSAEQIYNKLLDTPYSKLTKDSTCKNGQQGNFDVHSPEADEKSAESTAKEAIFDPEFKPLSGNSARDHAEQKKLAQQWRHHVAQANQLARQRGFDLPEAAQLAIERLLRPQLPWGVILRRHVEQTFGHSPTWQPPNRRYLHQGMYLPGQRANQLDITVAIDTSGSTSTYLRLFFSELAGILKSFPRVRVQLLECDSVVRQTHEFDDHNLHQLESWRPRGGGGTSFVPVFEHIAQNQHSAPRLLVFFTDGEGAAPAQAPGYPVLWMLTPQARMPYPPVGRLSGRLERSCIKWGHKVHMQEVSV